MDWEMYENHLRWHDWFYDYSDDQRTRKEGQRSYEKLQKRFEEATKENADKALLLWNSHAPKTFRLTR